MDETLIIVCSLSPCLFCLFINSLSSLMAATYYPPLSCFHLYFYYITLLLISTQYLIVRVFPFYIYYTYIYIKSSLLYIYIYIYIYIYYILNTFSAVSFIVAYVHCMQFFFAVSVICSGAVCCVNT